MLLQGSHCTVVIDVNWRPVFWDDEASAKATVLEYIQQAHILKVTDEVTAGGRGRLSGTPQGHGSTARAGCQAG